MALRYFGLCSKEQSSGFPLNTNVTNLAIRASWSYIEASEGTYSWDKIHDALNALPTGGVASLTINVVSDCPSWVLSQVSTITGTGGTFPVPWDTTFISKTVAMISAAGTEFGTNTSIVRVTIPILAGKTSETNLNNVGATLADWQAVGYSEAHVLDAYRAGINHIQSNFSQLVSSTRLPNDDGLAFDTTNGTTIIAACESFFDGLTTAGIAGNAGAGASWVFPSGQIPAEGMWFQEAAPLGNQTDFTAMITLIGSSVSDLEIYAGDIGYA